MSITVVQTVSANSLSFSFGSNTTPGNAIVVCVMSHDITPVVSGVTIGGVADNFAAAEASGTSAGGSAAAIWVDLNCGQAAEAVVVSGSSLNVGSGFGGVVAYEVSGVTALDAAGITGSPGGGASSSWTSGTAGPTGTASEIWVGCASSDSGSSHPAADSSFANTTFNPATAGYKVVSSTGNAVYSGTTSGNAHTAAVVVALKAPPLHTATASLTVTPSFSAARTRGKYRTGSLAVSPSFSASVHHVQPVKQGSWWGLHSVFEQSKQEFEAFRSNPPVACPRCGEPLRYSPPTKAGSGVERYCPYDGFQYPRDWTTPQRP